MSDELNSCDNCAVPVDKDPLVLCDECEGAEVAHAQSLRRELNESRAQAAQLREMLTVVHSGMNCVCRLNKLLGKEPPCQTCRIGQVLEATIIGGALPKEER